MRESVKAGARPSRIGGGGRRLPTEGSAPSLDWPIKEGVGEEWGCLSTHHSSSIPRHLLVMLKGSNRGQATGSSLGLMKLNAHVDEWGVEEGRGHAFAGVGSPSRLHAGLRGVRG